jgi:hypothetical protein
VLDEMGLSVKKIYAAVLCVSPNFIEVVIFDPNPMSICDSQW